MKTIHALFWFKPWVEDENGEFWTRLRELQRLLCAYHYNVDIIRTSKPGYVLYEDEYQVAAVPFADTF